MSHYSTETKTIGGTNANWRGDQTAAPGPLSEGATVEARLSALASIVELISTIASHAEGIANRVAGSRPEKDGAVGKPSPVPNGLPDTLALLHENIGAHLSRITAALSRTREALG